MDRPKVFDHEGQERDWDWLTARFGDVRLERVEVPEEVTQVYRIVALRERRGPAVQVVNVSDEEGNYLEEIRVTRYWPDAPVLPAWPEPVSVWRDRGVFGGTNDRGDIGYGMGHGDYYSTPDGGASSVWVADERGPSDLISGLGMLAGTNHHHLDVYFQLQDAEAQVVEEPPVTPPGMPPAVPPETPPVTPPEQPPVEAPVTPAEDRWQMLLDKLDQIIAMLEARVE